MWVVAAAAAEQSASSSSSSPSPSPKQQALLDFYYDRAIHILSTTAAGSSSSSPSSHQYDSLTIDDYILARASQSSSSSSDSTPSSDSSSRQSQASSSTPPSHNNNHNNNNDNSNDLLTRLIVKPLSNTVDKLRKEVEGKVRSLIAAWWPFVSTSSGSSSSSSQDGSSTTTATLFSDDFYLYHVRKALLPLSDSEYNHDAQSLINNNYEVVEKIEFPIVYETDGIYVKQAKALAMLHLVATHKSLDVLAEALLFGRYSVRRNATASLATYTRLAHDTSSSSTSSSSITTIISRAQRMTGLMHATSLGTSQRDYARALLYMSFAAVGGDTVATQVLGYWHLNGVGVEKDCSHAAFYYGRVAQTVYDTYMAGPPMGRTSAYPPKKRLSDDIGGIYGPGASGPGNPALMSPNAQSATGSAALSPQDIIQYFELNADKGSVEHAYRLGALYYGGEYYVGRNYKKAFLYFQDAVKGYPTDKMRAAEKQLKAGAGAQQAGTPPVLTQKDKEDAVFAAKAACQVGIMYWRGEGVLHADAATARKFFEQGVKWNDGCSKHALGVMYARGDVAAGIVKDMKRAKELWVEAAAMDKHVGEMAFTHLGDALFESAKGFKDYEQAFVRFNAVTTSANRKAPLIALLRLGDMYAKGLGVKENCQAGVQYYQVAVEKGDWHMEWIREAQALVAKEDDQAILSSASTSLVAANAGSGDYEGALVRYLLAAEMGYEVAQANAAWIIDSGLIDFESARKNLFTENQDLYEVALNMWNRAAIQGNVDARVKMGDYHFYGLGLPAQGTSSDKHSVTKGQESDQSSSSSTSPADSSYSSWLATLIPSIFSHSPFPWLNSFFNSVGQVLVLVPPQPVGNRSPNYEKAALYYQVAAETQYSALAIWNLGYMHELGIGVNKDYHLAKRLYDQSLATNPEAYLPVSLSLYKLYVKFAWEYVMSERILSSITGEAEEERGSPDLPLFVGQEGDANAGSGKSGGSGSDGSGSKVSQSFITDLIDLGRMLLRLDYESWAILLLCALVGALFLYRQQYQAHQQHQEQQQQPSSQATSQDSTLSPTSSAATASETLKEGPVAVASSSSSSSTASSNSTDTPEPPAQ